MLLKSVLFVLVVLCTVFCGNADVLFTSGWYKTRRKGEKQERKMLNNVSSIGPDFFPLNVTYLKIGGVIPVLNRGSVRDLRDLKELTLSSLGIISLQRGAFQNVPRLSRLNLKENGISHISGGIFNTLNITGLFLNKNAIKVIDGDAFDDMPVLRKIKLNSNQISVWDSNWFKRTPSLNVVLMRRNSIKEIPENAFKNFIRTDLAKQEKLSDLKLFLSKNKIAEIHPRAFVGLKRLGQLFLDRNKLTELNIGIFQGIEEIHVLNLARNNITGIPKELFLTVRSARMLDLSANHRLHCVPLEVASLVRNLKLDSTNNLNCTCIDELRKVVKVIGYDICLEY